MDHPATQWLVDLHTRVEGCEHLYSGTTLIRTPLVQKKVFRGCTNRVFGTAKYALGPV